MYFFTFDKCIFSFVKKSDWRQSAIRFHNKYIMQGIQKEFWGYMRELIPELNVSLSIGGTERTANEDTKTLYDRADKALYQAKNQKGELRLYEQTI